MIYIDNRTGSKDLKPYIPDSILVHLDSADASFEGEGPQGTVISVGIERKRIGDLLNSIATGRLSAEQLPKMLDTYQYNYIVVEGVWRRDKHDDTLWISTDGGHTYKTPHGRQRWTMEGVYHYLSTLQVIVNIRLFQTRTARDTAHLITYLYSWWQKPWEKHKSHLALHKGQRLWNTPRELSFVDCTGITKPSLARRIAAELPGVGVDRSRDVADYFIAKCTSVEDAVCYMFEATEEEWRSIPGVGKVTAKMCWDALHGGKHK